MSNQNQNQNQGPDINQIGKSFVEHYYKTFDNNRGKLQDLFRFSTNILSNAIIHHIHDFCGDEIKTNLHKLCKYAN